MCNIYAHKCEYCSTHIEMHLENYETGASEINVYCKRHIPKYLGGGVKWRWPVGKSRDECFVKFLTDNAREHKYGNSPNESDLKRWDGKRWIEEE